MIVRVLPTQVSMLWSLVKTGVIDFGIKHFPGNWELANNLFQQCLAGVVQIWLCSDVVGEKPELKGFFLTSVEIGNPDGNRNLSVLLIYAYKQPSSELIKEGRDLIRKFAQSNHCKTITISVPQGHREKLIEDAWGKVKKQTLFIIPVEA